MYTIAILKLQKSVKLIIVLVLGTKMSNREGQVSASRRYMGSDG